MSDNTDPVIVVQSGPVRTLTLNRPECRNALNDLLVDALDSALSAAENDPHTKCIVVAGNGKSFCAGADLQFFLGLHAEHGTPIAFLRRVSALVTRLETSPLPVVAAVHGHAVAGGLELALGCDVVVAAESALIGDGHVKNNLLPAGGSSVRLARKVGDSLARWLSLTGSLVPASRLAEAGWIHEVVPDDRLGEAALAVAGELVSAAGPAQSSFKSLLFDLTTLDSRRGLEKELEDFDAHWKSNDVPADLTAFLERKALSNRNIRPNTGEM